METLDIHEFYTLMDTNDVMLVYEGFFDQEMVKSVLSMAEKKLISDQVAEPVRRKLFNIMVELLQNLSKHQAKSDPNNPDCTSLFMIGKENGNFKIATGNLIPMENKKNIISRIDTVNAMDKEELKEHYKKARLSSVISDVGGAGLGFIDIARKSENKLLYSFYKEKNQQAFFVLLLTVNNN